MLLPTKAELDKVTVLIAGPEFEHFDDLGPQSRLDVLRIAMQANNSEFLDAIDNSLRTVAEWFDKSKVYYP